MQGFSDHDFIKYVDTLKFTDLEDAVAFVRIYHDYYVAVPDEETERKNDAWMKYVILMSRFGMMFLLFTESVIGLRKELQDENKESKSGDPAALASRAN